jgi:peptidoglycan hydrolase-like protein with peptidoglycan-binding domain
MSRSRRAVAETRWRGASAHGAGERRRLEDESLLERQLLPGAVSATKCAVILLAAGVLVMAAEPARAVAASVSEMHAAAQVHPIDPMVLARGSGYGDGRDAALVRSLQRALDRAGFTPGPIDGLYGPRTEDAVEVFQSAHSLRVDGTAGPITLSALRGPSTVLYPGAGYAGPGLDPVRVLQRRLRRDGYRPGPIDGRYGPLTERAVSRFQAAHGLQVDGIAGTQTFGELQRIGGGQQPPTRPRPSARRAIRPGTAAGENRGRTSRPGGASLPVAVVLAGLLALAAFVCGIWLVGRRGCKRTIAARQPPAVAASRGVDSAGESYASEQFGDSAAAELAFRRAEQHGDPTAASNLGVVLEYRGDLAGAEAAYRRADERGSADGAFNLAGLLLERGDLEGAMAAYHRADERGDAVAAAKLGMMLERQHDYPAALEAYARAQRSDRPEVAELARLRANALALGLSVAGKRGEQ